MSEVKDPAIKLFGRTIQLPPPDDCGGSTADITSAHPNHQHYARNFSENGNKKPLENELEDGSSHQISEDAAEPATSSGMDDEPKTPILDKESSTPNTTKKEDENETDNSQEKTLKKPDKILPCPRCNSMDTKFCYYNNYNVNQPRHFCKNCQRYWTAGGTMRNVPVGSGRRKNKHSSASHYRHLMISEALQAARADGSNGIHQPTLRTNGTKLTFGSGGTLCESTASALKLGETPHNGFHGPEQSVLIPHRIIENGDDHSSESSSTTSNSTDKGGNGGLHEPISKNFQGFASQVPLIPGPTWPCNWNSNQWSSPMPPTSFVPPGFPVSFYPTIPYWGCPLPNPWNLPTPWLPQAPSSPDPNVLSSSPISPTLGKHPRDGNMLRPMILDREEPSSKNDSERGIWIPKTLRIDDPSEAAKSSIWSTLGIRNEKADSGSRFRAFQSKSNDRDHTDHKSAMLHANPAAFSRSLNFREST